MSAAIAGQSANFAEAQECKSYRDDVVVIFLK
jgi:hypothetical protein